MNVRWGVIGAGGVARRRAMPAMQAARDCELVALMVRDQSRADALATEFGALRGYANWQDVIADDEVDAVYVASPVHAHAEQVIAAAEAGKHVLCDKPMAMTSDECRSMIEACSSNGVHLQVCFLMRFSSVYQELRRRIASGEFGPIVEARATMSKWMMPEQLGWRIRKDEGGGGPLMDLGAHMIDLLAYLIGPMDSVSALVSNRVEADWDTEDTSTVLMHAQSGAHAVVGNSFRTRGGETGLEITGAEMSATVLSNPASGEPTLVVYDGSTRTATPMPFENYYQLQIEHFADCIEGKSEPIATGADGLANLMTIEAAYRSAQTGVREKI